LGAEPPALGDFLGIYYQNNPFLGIFQMKFCLKTLGGGGGGGGPKKIPGGQLPPCPHTFRAYEFLPTSI